MKYKVIIILGALVASLGLSLVASLSKIKKLKDDNSRLETNMVILTDSTKILRSKNGKLYAEQGQLQMTVKELKATNLLSKDSLKEYGVKLKNLQNYNKILLKASTSGKTKIKDSIIYQHDSVRIPVYAKSFLYDDSWYKVNGLVVKDSVDLKIACRHEVNAATTATYKGWWIFKRLKGYKTTVWVTNPHDTITQVFSVNIKK